MIEPVLIIRWESFAVVAGAMALALWAVREPASADGVPAAAEPLDVAALYVVRPGTAPATLTVRDGCLLGRGRECDVVFDDATVSKVHARLRLRPDGATVEDLDSTNGVALNGVRLEGPAPLRPGDRIGLGTNQIVYLGAPSQGDA